jgi:chitin disaccharide deacetylase
MKRSRRCGRLPRSAASSRSHPRNRLAAVHGANRSHRPSPPPRYLIVNADDFGADDGTTRGILLAHELGIVTSTSLMVDMPGARAAVRAARAHPRLGLGLHVNFTAGPRIPDPDDLGAQRRELERQLDLFIALTGRMPTHVDSHHHVHRKPDLAPAFVELSRERGVPLRGFSGVTYVGNFYGQWTVGTTDLRHISPEYLMSLLADLPPGFSELACHPGDGDARFDPAYDWQRRIELDSLTDPRVRRTAAREGIALINFADHARLVGASSAGVARPVLA